MISMQYVLNPEIEGLSQILFIFLSNDMIVLIFGFIEVALRSDRLIMESAISAWRCFANP